MNERIKQLLARFKANITARSESERGILLAMAAAGIFMLWLTMVSDPLAEKIVTTENRITNINRQISDQIASYAEKLAASEEDPNRYANERLQVVTQEQTRLDEQMASLAGDLVTPAQMTEILGNVLASQAGLELMAFQNKEAVPLQAGVSSSAQNAAGETNEGAQQFNEFGQQPLQGQVYEHGLVIEFQGSFFDTLRYLRFLENISGNFFWDVLSYEMLDWPSAHVRLEIHTLSTERGFIGV